MVRRKRKRIQESIVQEMTSNLMIKTPMIMGKAHLKTKKKE